MAFSDGDVFNMIIDSILFAIPIVECNLNQLTVKINDLTVKAFKLESHNDLSIYQVKCQIALDDDLSITITNEQKLDYKCIVFTDQEYDYVEHLTDKSNKGHKICSAMIHSRSAISVYYTD